MPAPSAGAGWTLNGLETKQSMKAKKTAMSPNTGTTHAISSRERRLSQTARPA